MTARGLSGRHATVAWIESPFQLVSLIEATQSGALRRPVRALLRRPSLPFDAVLRLLDARPVDGLSVETVRHCVDAGRRVADASELVIGDLYSGQAGLLLLQHPSADVVVIDDGSSTLSALEQLGSSGGTLLRPRTVPSRRRRLLARATHRRLRSRWPHGVRVVTGLPVEHEPRSPGPQVERHHFEWSRSAAMPWGLPGVHTVVLGSALAADGLIEQAVYEEWLERVIDTTASHRTIYLPHRRESESSVATVRRCGGIVATTRGLPVELVASALPSGTRVATLPSTTVLTLPIVADHVAVECWDVPDHWWCVNAPDAIRRLLASVSSWHHERVRAVESPVLERSGRW